LAQAIQFSLTNQSNPRAVTQPQIPALHFPRVVLVNTCSLAVSLVVSLALFPLAQFKLTRAHGLVKLVIYACFMGYNIYAAIKEPVSTCHPGN
jgi:Ca2+/Na+ antiporter